MPLAHPLSIQLTPTQLLWLDSCRKPLGLSRSAMLRLMLQDAMRLSQYAVNAQK